MTDLSMLTKPFDNVRTREGAAGRSFDYVAGGDVLERILEATQGQYDWQILDIRLVEGQAKANRKTGEVYTTPAVWMVHGRLTLPGLGSRDGVGTQVAENEESPKAAETDALKRSAVKFGVALHLYLAETPPVAAPAGRTRPTAAASASSAPSGKCEHCRVTNGKPGSHHAPTCPNRTEARAA